MALAKHSRDSLTSLDVSWCRYVSDQGLGLLADTCRHLRNLRVFGCSQVSRPWIFSFDGGVLSDNLTSAG